MKKSLLLICAAMTIILGGCSQKASFKVYGWINRSAIKEDADIEKYFSKAAEAGVDAIFLECHGGYPVIVDSSSYVDQDAIDLLTKAGVCAKKYGVQLHAWMWTTNRCEKTLLRDHPEWYQVNGNGESCADIKLYGREHYRFLCPNHEGVLDYMKDRVREIAAVPGVDGIHMDFIRYPDAILPYGLHKSRGVVQDKVYPLWDHCYCEECRAGFKAKTGIDPMDLEDAGTNPEWLQYRWDLMARYASDIADEIHNCGKISSAAVFASPEESRKLVRQDWTHFKNVDIFMPMIYTYAYAQPESWIQTATAEGVEELKAEGNAGELVSGVALGRNLDEQSLGALFDYAKAGGASGISLFCLESIEHKDAWSALKNVIASRKNQ